jgi:hypothetical protein
LVLKNHKEPWKRTYSGIVARCGPNKRMVLLKNYAGKGIKCRITPEELKKIWFRDKAYSMERPSIDRINPNKDYVASNCRYLEVSENSGRARGEKTHCKFGHKIDCVQKIGHRYCGLCQKLHKRNAARKNWDASKKKSSFICICGHYKIDHWILFKQVCKHCSCNKYKKSCKMHFGRFDRIYVKFKPRTHKGTL